MITALPVMSAQLVGNGPQNGQRTRKQYEAPTYRTAIDFINHIEDLLLAFGLPLVLVDVTGGRRKGLRKRKKEVNQEKMGGEKRG